MTCDSRTPSQLNSGQLIDSIKCDLADNNAGLISAADVRENMEDIAFSINKVVASGDTETAFPFFNAVKATTISGGSGMFIPESGISFPNSPVESERTKLQVRPWLGPEGINHDELSGRNSSDNAHTQYLPRTGSKKMQGNLGMDSNWINSSGSVLVDGSPYSYSDRGFRFVSRVDSDTNYEYDDVEIGTSGSLKFNKDLSSTDSFHGVAKAWLRFVASATPEVLSYHNISGIERTAQGKYTITFTSGTFMNNSYVAVANSNARSTASNGDDFDLNTVGCFHRTGDDGTTLRTISYHIQKDDNSFVDGSVCDLVCYGFEPGSRSGTPPTITVS
tara:strand:- start:970 stop:1968 length:999 start_codon:yes stop_codon:yes gene_type:complete